MGQQAMGCCVQRDRDGVVQAGSNTARGERRKLEHDLSGLRSKIGSLNSVVEDLQSEMLRLRGENHELAQKNGGLADQNRKLRRTLEEQDVRKAWRSFDVV